MLAHIPVTTTTRRKLQMNIGRHEFNRSASEVFILTSFNVFDNAARIKPATLDYLALCSNKIFYRLQLAVVRTLRFFKPPKMVRYKMP